MTNTTSTTTTLAVPTTTEQVLPGVPPCRGATSAPAIRPAVVLITCGDGAVGVRQISWSWWGPFGGYGFGTADVNSCQPTCATGSVADYPASIYVFGPSAVGVPAFEDVTVTPTGTSGQVESSSMAGTWGAP